MNRHFPKEQALTMSRVKNALIRVDPLRESASAKLPEVLNESTFKRMIAIERKRTERSREPFLLMLLEDGQDKGSKKHEKALGSVVSALLSTIRDTDVIGWHEDGATLGVIYTGLVADNRNSVQSMILNRVSVALQNQLTFDQFSRVNISFHFYPDNWDFDNSGRPSNPALYPDLLSADEDKRSLVGIKRAMDMVGSLLMLVLLAPLLLIIALAIKASSKGPALFKQKRVGHHGQLFTMFKFRSMYINNDHTVHKEFVTKFIASDASKQASTKHPEGVYKLTNDKRITRIGKFLRKTSLDELPQLLNVLKGDMSLVGPRPPIPYEVAVYETWHRRRVLGVKPGITGLWQVSGRSRVKFDEMVRLDVRYAESWTPWLDFIILLRTPLAVIRGNGAA